MNKFLNFNKIICFGSGVILFLSFLLIIYTLQYNILIDHDFNQPYGRSFFHPEHGRYIATYINNVLTEKIPYWFNIHPNIVVKYLVNPIKAFIIIFFCLIFSNTFFIAQKDKKSPFSFDFGNIAFILTYVVIFLSVFNCSFFFNVEWSYFMTQQSTKFWEYAFSLFWWVLMSNCIAFYIVNPNLLSENKITKLWILTLLFTFITGITIEPVNAPVAFVFFVGFLLFLFNIRKFNKTVKIKVFSLFIVFILSLICYYINPNDEILKYSPYTSYFNYLINDFLNYCSVYIHSNFFKEMSLFTVLLSFFLITIYIKTKDVKFIFFVLLNLLSLFVFYFAIFLLGKTDENDYYIITYTTWIWMFLYKLMSLYTIILTIGYTIDRCLIINKKNTIKFILCILSLIIFSKCLIIDYPFKLNTWIKDAKEQKLRSYIVEKVAIKYPDTETIILPAKYKNIDMRSLMLHIPTKDYAAGFNFINYLQILHFPELQNKKQIIILDNYEFDKDLFTDEELQKMDFQKLLTHKIHKNEIINYD